MSGRSATFESLVRIVKRYSFFIILALPLLGGVIAEVRSSGKVSGNAIKPAVAAQQPWVPALEDGAGIYGIDRIAASTSE